MKIRTIKKAILGCIRYTKAPKTEEERKHRAMVRRKIANKKPFTIIREQEIDEDGRILKSSVTLEP